VVPVSALIQHPMETGYRVGPEGQPLPRELIRRVECRFDGETVFTYRRAKGLRYGEAVVRVSPELDWNQLVEESTTTTRKQDYVMNIAEVKPLGRLSSINRWIDIEDGKMAVPAESEPEIAAEVDRFHDAVREWLDHTTRKDAYVFIHGFNNTFDHAMFRIAEIWHFMGRQGVPIAYTWPAARGGIRGYTYDRESGEYTINHLKQFLRALASTPGLERIHLISHSRGTDVTATAVRELYIEAKAAGEDPSKTLKIGTLVLAAPDIDTEVFSQRFGAEMVCNATDRTVVYFSPDDEAIWWARWLFDSVRRLGQLLVTDITPDERERLAQLPRMELIDCTVSGFSTSHNYVFSHPSAMSDLILVVRDGCPPGCCERPLTPTEGIWSITNQYMVPVKRLKVGESEFPEVAPEATPETAPAATTAP
jgi:esterase/lipase superfamily enzyme